MAVKLKSEDEIARSCARPAKSSARHSSRLREMVQPGLNLLEIEQFVRDEFRARGAKETFLQLRARAHATRRTPRTSASASTTSSSTASRETVHSRKATSSPSTSARHTRATSAMRPSPSASARSAPKPQPAHARHRRVALGRHSRRARGQTAERHPRRHRGHHPSSRLRHRQRAMAATASAAICTKSRTSRTSGSAPRACPFATAWSSRSNRWSRSATRTSRKGRWLDSKHERR